MLRKLIAGLTILLLVSITSRVFATTYYVPDNFSTIQAALDGVASGNTIVVRDGTYTGIGNIDLDFKGKAITLRSEHGANSCTIYVGGPSRGFKFHSGETPSSIVDGFTIKNSGMSGIYCESSSSPTIRNCIIKDNHSYSAGGGIACYNSSPIISNCVITNNYVNSPYWGGGVYCHSSSPIIENCEITYNWSFLGGGIACYNSSPVIRDCTISANENGPTVEGGGIYCSNSSVSIDNSIITGNGVIYAGGGIACRASTLTINNCNITGNSAEIGGGISCSDSSLTMTACTISDNTAKGAGGGFHWYNSSPVITGCKISGNTAESAGGIYCGSQKPLHPPANIVNCIVTSNSAVGPIYYQGGGIFVHSSQPILTNCTISGNSAQGIGSGIYCYGGGIYCNDASPTLTNCILWANSASNGPEIALSGDVTHSSMCVSYSNVDGGSAAVYVQSGSELVWNEGNIEADPIFVVDHHLGAGSPCIDAGTDASVYLDIDGDIRPFGERCDIGADEYYGTGPISICLSQDSLNILCQKGENAPPQAFAVWNCGGPSLFYTVSDDADWLSCAPDTGVSIGERDTITVSYNTSGLNAGNYLSNITISDPNSTSGSQTITVNLTVTQPRIACDQTNLVNSCLKGDNAANQVFAVWNAGTGTLSYSISDNDDWLLCTPANGTSTGEHDTVTVTYVTANLLPGTYPATITISAPNSVNDPQYVSVQLTVIPLLTGIGLLWPWNSAWLSSPPTFMWEPYGGSNNAFAVEINFNSKTYSTYKNLGQTIYENSWTMSSSNWNKIPHKTWVRWRVRGRDLDHSPVITISSDWWSFYKQ